MWKRFAKTDIWLPSSVTVSRNGIAAYTVTVGPLPGFAGTVTLSATGPAASLGIPEKNTIALMPQTIAGQKINYIVLDDASDTTAAVKPEPELIIGPEIEAMAPAIQILPPTAATGLAQFGMHRLDEAAEHDRPARVRGVERAEQDERPHRDPAPVDEGDEVGEERAAAVEGEAAHRGQQEPRDAGAAGPHERAAPALPSGQSHRPSRSRRSRASGGSAAAAAYCESWSART